MLSDALENAFISVVACPSCQTSLMLNPTGALICGECNRIYPKRDGIWRFLSVYQEAHYQSFLEAYQHIRHGEGWEREDDAYYLALPEVKPDDPQAAIWRIRRQTFAILKKQLTHIPQSWALDLGAGNCWLSRHLALANYRVLALDINLEGRDGLSGGNVYLNRKICTFLRGQASMDCLPVHDEQVTLCVISGALHYANVQKTLQGMFRVLKPGGQLIIMDSPVYNDSKSGLQMREQLVTSFKSRYNIGEVATEGAGYLVFDEILAVLKQIGFKISVHWPDQRTLRLVRRIISRTTMSRETACFPLFVGTKPLFKR